MLNIVPKIVDIPSLGRKCCPCVVAFRTECVLWVLYLSTERHNPNGLLNFG
jgi:hypothetical protein